MDDVNMDVPRPKRPRTEETSPAETIELPVYQPDDKAVDVFDNVYFYRSEDYLNLGRKDRKDTLKNMTVKEVYLKYTVESGKGEDGLSDLIIALRGILQEPVLKYYADVELSLEDRLHGMKTINLSGEDEVALFNRRKPSNIPTASILFHATMTRRNSKNEEKRSKSLGLVLGPSGSGKTFFALHNLSQDFLVESAEKKVTIYLQAKDAPIQFNEDTGDKAARELVAWIKRKIPEKLNIDVPKKPLEMHVCLIIDEAGVAQCKWWFENEAMLSALCEAAKEVATNVVVVVAGTGLTGNAVSSSDGAYVFRMKPWKSDDVGMILNNYADSLNLVHGETSKTVADAIFANPKLGALASNGRSAYYLVRAIAEHSTYYKRLSWSYQLQEWTKTLVMQVVHEYIASNGICYLNQKEQRRVAASIFRGLRHLKSGNPQQIDLIGINARETPVAVSLLQYNCELVDGNLQLLEGERFACTVSPAIAIVLYAMLGISATLNPGWKAEEELAALFAVQQLAIKCMDMYVSDRCQDTLDKSLEQIRLLSLKKQLKSATTDGKIFVPMVGAGTVLVNYDKAPFADVIVKDLLIQTKQDTSSRTLTTNVNLYHEMEKCCLLKSSNRDTRVLQGLIEMWRCNLEPTTHKTNQSDQQQRSNRNPQDSKAFPANLLCLVPQKDPIEYAVIEGNDITIGNVKHSLPPLDGITITFMVSTNLDKMRLTVSSDGSKITITERQLDEDLRIKDDSLDPVDQALWQRFMRDHVREGIEIKFLLTKSV